MDNTVELLKKLTSTVGVSGEEENIVTLLKDILKKYGNVSVDSMNNVYCTFGQGYHFLLDAHLDEIGMIVTDITDDGFIKVNRCGGIDRRMLLGYEVSVWGKEEEKGIISTLPPHLQNADDEKKVPEFKDISIDVGMSKEKIKKIVIIDHHRRSPDIIEGALLNYIEVYASSTSEMVTELIQYMLQKPRIPKIIAEGLLGGIFMDTKGFQFKSGVRTFDAAAFLRSLGADTIEVKKMFTDSLGR